ncbi:MAG: zinc ribbon domain-containing protein [Planctomycetota bacterium]|jgi:ribosomal protein L40E
MPHNIDSEKHRATRSVLRTLGPLVLGAGVLMTVIGFGSFFLSFSSGGMPSYFWCAFVGLPLIFLGFMLCKFGYAGSILRYMASEAAPVGKDTVNYMVDGTKDSMRDAAEALGEGISSGMAKGGDFGAGGAAETVVRCHKCNADNDADAKFCDNCGAALSKTVACAGCGELNDPDAKFCDNCGKALAG